MFPRSRFPRSSEAAGEAPAATYRQVRASFDDRTITVYQAYAPAIARPAVQAGRFVPPFRRDRMTWIKPSFRWMLYRSGWAIKPGQEHVLAIRISRRGFEWALAHSCLSHAEPAEHADERQWREQLLASPVRVQWDPERSLTLAPLAHRAIQVGLSGEALERYVDEWTEEIIDVTPLARRIRDLVREGDPAAAGLLPAERPYPLPAEIAERIAATE